MTQAPFPSNKETTTYTVKPQGEHTGGESLITAEAENLEAALDAAYRLWQHYLTPVEVWDDSDRRRVGVWLGFVYDE
jgi:hypothetical protein